MQVRVGSTLSDLYDQEQGVPQGGVLSTTLFNIKINDIVKCLDNLTDCSLYVDDFCTCFRSKSMRTIERHLQQNLNKIEHWATYNGWNFPSQKHSVCISVSCESNTVIQFLHYMDRLFLLYRNTNILVWYLTKSLVLFRILNTWRQSALNPWTYWKFYLTLLGVQIEQHSYNYIDLWYVQN